MTKLQDILHDLPIYGDYDCSDVDCTHPAVVRHPAEGKFYCSGHAQHLAESHLAYMQDLTMAAKLRQRMLKATLVCDDCEKPAERMCANCYAPICFDHMHLLPRTGAICLVCSRAWESEARG